MKCNNCGSENLDGAKFCNNCGTALVDTHSKNINANVNLNIKNETTERIINGIDGRLKSGTGAIKTFFKIVIPIGIILIIGIASVEFYQEKQQEKIREQQQKENFERLAQQEALFKKEFYNHGKGKTLFSDDGKQINVVISDISIDHLMGEPIVQSMTINGSNVYGASPLQSDFNYINTSDRIYETDNKQKRYKIQWDGRHIVNIQELKKDNDYEIENVYVNKQVL